ncbi:MAG: hypothetical protein EXX96DRAFT_481107 [Benjaminiella poitrasii]|nr:MAG: hypothetical protein EXX96DRAFT_481107 [Benjaminiella poitrasii]
MKYQLERKNVLSSLEKGVQVLNFQRGSILLKEGSKNHGVFLVMDGALEVFVANIDSQTNIHKQQETDFDDSLSNFIIIDDRKVAYRYPYGRISHQDDVKDENSKILFTIGPGQTAGYFSALTKQASTFGIRAKSDCIVGYFSPACIRNIVHYCPPAMIELSKRVLNCMKPLFMHIDISLQSVQMSAGQVICNKDNPIHSAFIVQYGRLKKTQVSKDQDGIEISQEYSKGDSTDELEFLIKSDVSTAISSTWTLNAMQDSGVICIPKTLISAFTLYYPQIPLRLSRRAADRTLSIRSNEARLYQSDKYQQFPDDLRSSISSCNSSINQYTMISSSFRNSKRPVRIVALIPISDHVSLRAFAEHLKSALIESVGAKCALVTRSIVKTACKGAPFSSKVGRHRLALKLAELEENEHVVLYAADDMMNSENQSKKSFWTQTCMRQADCVLFIANADDNPLLTGYEHMLLDLNKTARKEIVLLHSTKLCVPGTTNAWLKNRTWIEAHHHIMMPIKRSAAQVESSSIKYISIMENLKNVKYRGILRQQKDHKNSSHHSSTTIDKQVRADFARLSRRLCRKAVALVLGGGSSTRGIIKCITMINALEETGIPIDIIGGTNVGSLVSACYAKNANRLLTVRKLKAFVQCLNSPWRYILQFTHLFITKSTGHILNRMIQDCIGKDIQMEDFWLPSFAVTTDITYSYMKVHTSGDASKYIHALMSLPGQTPPLVDSDESTLMYERYSDHFPLAVAKDMGADLIIAVDISSAQKESFNFGGILSVLYAFCRNSILSVLGLASVKGKMLRIPSINQMQTRLSSVLNVNILQAAKTTEGVLYVNLPCTAEKYSQIFTSDDIYQESINITRRIVSEWNKHGFASGRISS